MMAAIDNLSPELLVMVFSQYIRMEGHEKFLRNIPRVCKHWNKVSSTASLWKKVRTCNPKYLMKISQRGLLHYTERLELYLFDTENSEMDLSAVFKEIKDLKSLVSSCDIVVRDILKVVSENCKQLELLHFQEVIPTTTSNQWEQFLTVCGPTLNHLVLRGCFSWETGQQLVSLIAEKCPLLQELVFIPKAHYFHMTPFPIQELRSGCPRLKELEFHYCQIITTEKNDELKVCGFEKLKMFSAECCDFGGFDVHKLLKDSVDLECLKLCSITNLVSDNIWKIPSEKVWFLSTGLQDPNNNLKTLGDAVSKWRHTLSHLELCFVTHDVSYLFERFLQDNPNPKIMSLIIYGNVDSRFFEQFIQRCKNLIHLQINMNIYDGREKIEEALELFMKEGNST